MSRLRVTTAYFLALGLALSSLFLVTQTALAEPAYTINYQGKLTNNTGAAVADGLYNMEFKLYDALSGGTTLWTETRTGGNQVQVTNGLFSVMLGDVTSLTSVDFSQALYLGVNIDNDGEMSPRKALGTVPSAFEARQLGGVASSSFLRSDQDDTAAGLLTFSGGFISSASSTITQLSTGTSTITTLVIGGDTVTDLTGTGIQNVGGALTLDTTGNWTGTFDGQEGSYYLDLTNASGTTDNLTEGTTNLFFTNARARTALSEIITGIDYTSGTGVFSLTSGYTIPLTASTTQWATAYGWGDHSTQNYFDRDTNTTDDLTEGSTNRFSQWLVNGSALYYSAGNVGIGTSTPTKRLSVDVSTAADGISLTGNDPTFFLQDGTGTLWSHEARGDNFSVCRFGSSCELTILGASGNVGIGTTTPARLFTVAGDLFATGALYDSADSAGTNGMVLQTTGAGTQWVATSSLGIGGSAVSFGIDNQIPFTNAGGTDFDYSANLTFNGSTLTTSVNNASGYAASFINDGNLANRSGILVQGGLDDSATTGPSTLIQLNDGNGDAVGSLGFGSGDFRISTPAFGSRITIDGGGYNQLTFETNLSLKNLQATWNTGFAMGGVDSNIALGSNYLSGDGDDEGISIDASGQTTFSGTAYLAQGALGTGGISFAGDTNTGIFRAGVDALGFSTNGTERLRIDANGNVGIGTTTPSYKLDVAGKIGINGTQVVYLPDQSDFTGSLIYGNGGTSLSHSSANQGFYNTGIGMSALRDITTGSNNTAVGYQSMLLNTSGGSNTALGVNSLRSNTVGSNNTAVGVLALYYNTFGTSNTALGVSAGERTGIGDSNANPSNSVYLGYDTRASASLNSNEIVIGSTAIGNGSNSATLGNDSITKTILKGNVGIGTTSPSARLTLQTTGTTNILDLYETGGQNVLTVLESGQVGLGTTPTTDMLEIYSSGNQLKFIDTTGSVYPAKLSYTYSGGLSLITKDGLASSQEEIRFGSGFMYDGTSSVTGTLTQGDVKFYLGTAGNPEFQIYSGSTVFFEAFAGGVKKVAIGAGVDTSNAATLQVTGDGYFSANVGIATTTPGRTLTVAGDIYATGALYDSSNNAGTPGMVLQTTGAGTQWVATSSLGIGGSIAADSLDFTEFADSMTLDANTTFDTTASYGLTLQSGVASINLGGDSVVISSTNYDINDTAFRAPNGAVGTPAFSFANDTNTGMYRSAADELSFSTNGTQRLRIASSGTVFATGDIESGSVQIDSAGSIYLDTYARIDADYSYISAGNFGIGTTTDFSSETLVVDGDAYVTGSFIDSTHSSGTPGMVLQTTGAGTQWVATSSLGIGGSIAADSLDFTEFADSMTLDANTTFDTTASYGLTLQSGVASISLGGDSVVISSTNYDINDTAFRAPNGAVGTPAFSFANDTNTGMYRIAADTLGFSTNATERLRIDASGNLGIGTTTPSSRFVVQNASTASLLFGESTMNVGFGDFEIATISGSSESMPTLGRLSGVAFADDIYFTHPTLASTWSAIGMNTFSGALNVNAYDDFTISSITGTGNIGIGTTTPTTLLHMQRDSASTVGAVLDNFSSGSLASASFAVRNDAADAAGASLTVFGKNATGAGAGAYGADGAVLASGADLSNGLNILALADAIKFYTGGFATSNERMRITNTGNVGIGTTTPGAKLDIVQAAAGNGMRIFRDGGYNSEGNNNIRLLDSSGSDTALQIGTDSTNDIGYIQAMQPATSWTSRALVLQGNGGNVGIGTTTPAYKLDVAGTVRSTSGLRVSASGIDTVLSVDGSGAYLEAQGANNLRFYTNAAERIRITSSGNVGIGTTSPRGILDVAGGLNNYAYIGGNAAGHRTVRIGQDASGYATIQGIGVSPATASDLTFQPTGGNIGIGTLVPDAKLEVYNGDLLVSNTGASPARLSLHGDRANNSGDAGETVTQIEMRSDNDTDGFNISMTNLSGDNDLIFSRVLSGTPTDLFTFRSTGRFGIGTTTPPAELTVSGTNPALLTDIGVGQYLSLDGVSGAFRIQTGGDLSLAAAGATATFLLTDSGAESILQSSNNHLTLETTRSADDIIFRGNSVELMRIDASSGEVGIGTAAPDAKFEVYNGDGIISNTGASPARLSLRGDRANNSGDAGETVAQIEMRSDNNQDGFNIRMTNGSSVNDLIFAKVSSGSPTDVFTVRSTGDVGIGTTTPDAKLQVDGDIALGTPGGPVRSLLAYDSSAGAYTQLIYWTGANGILGRNTPGGTVDNWYIRTAGIDRLTVNSTGNVGIGTTTPAQKLQVLGDIRVGTAGSNGCLEDFGGGLIAGTCSSDAELKTDITPVATGESFMERFMELDVVTYKWNQTANSIYSKNTSIDNLGLIAQNVESVFPELISYDNEGYRQVDFRAFPFYMIEALKEIWDKVTGNSERIEELEQENRVLKNRLDAIEDELNIQNNSSEPQPQQSSAPASTPGPSPTPSSTPAVTEEQTENTDVAEPVVQETVVEPEEETVIETAEPVVTEKVEENVQPAAPEIVEEEPLE